jgi:hypothetical protein
MLDALGVTMMAFVLLGPVVQPWYLTWGIIIVAPVVTGRCGRWSSGSRSWRRSSA